MLPTTSSHMVHSVGSIFEHSLEHIGRYFVNKACYVRSQCINRLWFININKSFHIHNGVRSRDITRNMPENAYWKKYHVLNHPLFWRIFWHILSSLRRLYCVFEISILCHQLLAFVGKWSQIVACNQKLIFLHARRWWAFASFAWFQH